MILLELHLKLKRYDIFHGELVRWGEVANVSILRLFRKGSGHFIRPVHEVLEVSGKVIDSPLVLYHYAHDDISSFLKKVSGYAQLEAHQRYISGKKTSVFELIAWPIGKFFGNVFLRLAWLDGWRGLVYAMMMSIHSLAVRAYLMEMSELDETR
jgi:hypothetical protein